MSKLIIASLVLFSFVVAVSVQGQETKKPIMFNYGQIPFGKSIDEILEMIEGLEVEEVDVDISRYHLLDVEQRTLLYENYKRKNYISLDTISSSLNESLDFSNFLINKFIKVYNASYGGEEWIDSVFLLFSREYGTEDLRSNYTLFSVSKYFVPFTVEKNTKSIFETLKTKISKIVKVEPFNIPIMEKNKELDFTRYICTWETKSLKVILEVYRIESENSSAEFSGNYMNVIYIDNAEWNKYRKSRADFFQGMVEEIGKSF